MIRIEASHDIVLDEITGNDIEACRRMKNAHRDTFFYSDIITRLEQRAWFARYLQEKDNYIFLIRVRRPLWFGFCTIGSIGYRLKNDVVDIYNEMMHKKHERRGMMGLALVALCGFVRRRYPGKPVTVYVKHDNYEAYLWYLRNGFEKQSESDTYYLMRLRD